MSDAEDAEFDRMIDAPPGPELAAWLCTLDINDVSAHDLVSVAAAWERHKAFTDARMVQALAELTDRPEYQQCTCPTDADIAHTHRAVEPAGDEVSLALAWSPGRARNQVSVATELCDELPATLTALEDGLIDYDKARLITDRTRCLNSVELRQRVESRVLGRAPRQTRTQLDHALRREVIAADPDGAEQRRRTASEQRRMSRPEPAAPGGEDGMARVELYGPAEDLAALYTAVDAAARHIRGQGDPRTLDQLRFDILTGLGWTALDTGHLGCCNPTCTQSQHRLATMHGNAATVNVTVSASTLLGTDDNPGHLDGFGPITAEASRRISTEGPWRRLLTESTGGQLLDYGRTTYTRLRVSPRSSSPEMPPAASPPATTRRAAATSTTSTPTSAVVTHPPRTPGPCTAAITSARPTIASRFTPTLMAPPGGPRRPGTPTLSNPKPSAPLPPSHPPRTSKRQSPHRSDPGRSAHRAGGMPCPTPNTFSGS